MPELISDVLNQEEEKGDGKDTDTEMERQGNVRDVGNEASPQKQTTLLLFLTGSNPADVI